MRTVRSSGRLGGGGCLLLGVCSGGGSAQGGGSAPGGVSAPGGGVSAPGGGGVSHHALRQTPPPPRGQTDSCKNITFATSLRTVKIAS